MNRDTVVFDIIVHNSGYINDWYNLSITSVSSGWCATLNTYTINVNPGLSPSVQLSMTPMMGVYGTSGSATVFAVSQGDNSKTDTQTVTANANQFTWDLKKTVSNTQGLNNVAWPYMSTTSASNIAAMLINQDGTLLQTGYTISYWDNVNGYWMPYIYGWDTPGNIYDFSIGFGDTIWVQVAHDKVINVTPTP